MASGKAHTQTRSKASFIAALQALGYTVTSQGEIIATLLGVSVAQAEEIEALSARVAKLEGNIPTSFKG